MDKLQTPPIRTPLAEGDRPAAAGKTAKEWYLHWKQTSDLVNDLEDTTVRGKAALTTVNQIPKVVAAGELGESSINDDGTRVRINANVGIWTGTVPIGHTLAGRAYLTVEGPAEAGVVELSANTADGIRTTGILQWTDKNVTAADKRHALILGVTSGTTANDRGGALLFYTRADGGAIAERMRIEQDGSIGIGATTPGWPLDVAGDVNASGVYRVGGTQVVGPRGAGLTASGASVGATAPATYNPAFETSLATLGNNLKTRLDELELRLKAHGLIA